MMRPVAAGLGFILALSSMSAAADEGFAGCWTEKRGSQTFTMRWFADGPDAWRGDMQTYGANLGSEYGVQSFGLLNTRRGWLLCPLGAPLAQGASCHPAAFGEAPASAAREWMELRADAERLVFVYHADEEQTVLFAGSRNACPA